MKILLVEDNPADQMFVTRSLRQEEELEYQLELCGSLAEALDQLSTSQFDVILLDLWLPDCEGLETCRRIVAAAQNTPVVVMTLADDRNLATEAIRGGAQDYLVKGAFPGSAIVRVLQYAIDRQQFRSELAGQETHFRQLFSHVPAIIWTTDRELKITSAMGAGLQFLDLDPQQIIGKTVPEYLQFVDGTRRAIKAHRRALRGKPVAFESIWLGRIFEVKIDSLRERKGEIVGAIGVALDVTERRSLDREISFARSVQLALLPPTHPCLKGYEIYGVSYPARQTCGDWFDYLDFSDGSLGLVVGDVAGKGFGPAILSATIAAYLDVLAETHTNVLEILNLCNRLACRRDLERLFVVLTLGQLKPRQRTLVIGGAGDGALIVGRNGQLKHRIVGCGMPIGLIEDTRYTAPVEVVLESGDIVLMLTDGFREAFNQVDQQQFGETRVVETVATNANSPACEILKALWQASNTFAGGHSQQDDMSGIVIKVLDPQS